MMGLSCYKCGKEMGEYLSGFIKLSLCQDCKASDEDFYRSAKNPEQLLGNIFLHGEYSDIIGFESDAGATRIYTASREAIDSGVVMMHYIRSEEVQWSDELRNRLSWFPKK